jgi:acyl dehydratase
MARFLEDLAAGDVFTSGARTVTLEEIVTFARAFDPQPFHLDPAAAERSFFGRLIGSGWHTAALTMRLLTEVGLDISGGLIGAGMDELRWPSALVPGDTIHVRAEVLSVRASRSRPAVGIVRVDLRTLRADDTAVQTAIANIVVPRRVS